MNAVNQPSFQVSTRPGGERRLSHRLFLYWLLQCRERDFASLEDVDPSVIKDDWGWCYIIDVNRSKEFPFFEHLGEQLAKYSGVLLSGDRDWKATLLDKATEKFQEILAERAPILIEDELTLFDGRRLLFRSIMLPLSYDQRNIDHILGAANGKVVDA
ncbi:MAG: hypothetical protein AAGL49_02900 [Pseudomonadota bacterium]